MSSSPALAAPQPDPPTIEARLEINTSAAGPGADVLHRRIEERANIVLRREKVLPGDSKGIALQVSVRELDDDEPGFAVRFIVRAADGSRAGEPTKFECSLCTETELIARIEAELEPTIQVLREQALEPETPSESPLPPAPNPVDDTPAPRPKTGMLAGGITLLVLGTSSLGAAVGLLVPAPKVDQDDPLDLITTRPIGAPVLAGGVVMVVVGAVMTAIAVNKGRQPKLSLAPSFWRGQVGAVLGWSFQ